MKKLNISRGDIFGGITAGVVALPLALAFGVQSGLGAAAGLYGAIFLGILASVFGGTPSQVSGPTGPMTVVSASLVAMFIAKYGSLDQALGMILLTFLLGGLFQIVFGLIKLGQYIRYIPYPVLSGFMSGIGIIIIALQLYPLMGLNSPKTVIDVFLKLPDALSHVNVYSLLLSGITIAFIYLIPIIKKGLPATLIALVLVSLINYFAGFDVKLIGEISAGLPALQWEAFLGINLSDLLIVIGPALTLAGLGTLDTLLTSIVADNVTHTKHKSNRELIGQGIGNGVAALFGGLPGAGATMRTLVNIKSGGRNRISGVIHGLLLILILLGLGRFVAWIPLPVLAGILVTVGFGIIDRKGLADIFYIPKADAVVLVVVLLLTVFVDLLQAVGIGMIIASVLFMKRAGDLVESGTKMVKSTIFDKEIPWDDESQLNQETLKKIYIQRLDGPVFFGAITRFQSEIASLPAHVKVVIFRMKRVPFIDQSGLYAIETAVRDLQHKNIRVIFTIVQQQPMYMFKKVKLVPGLVPEHLCFKTFEECSLWLNEHIDEI